MIDIVALSVFCFSIISVLTVYLGYPLVLMLVAERTSHAELGDDQVTTNITVVIVARNEASGIGKKLDNILLQTAADRIHEIIVVSDHSSDETASIVRDYEGRNSHIRLIELTDSYGKASGVNTAVASATGDIIVFADVRQLFERNAIEQLCQRLREDSVGGVCGQLRYCGTEIRLGLYWYYETWIRKMEARHDSVLGCTGAIYAIRRRLFTPMPDGLILDDIWVPAHVVMQGFRVLYEPGAVALDKPVSDSKLEFRKTVRTLAGNYQLLELKPDIVKPGKNRLWWSFLFHKVVRLIVPALLVLILISSFFLPARLSFLAVSLQIGFYLSASASLMLPVIRRRCRICRLCEEFVVLNAAAAVAFIKSRNGKYAELWEPV